jgi:hypothetical protein
MPPLLTISMALPPLYVRATMPEAVEEVPAVVSAMPPLLTISRGPVLPPVARA